MTLYQTQTPMTSIYTTRTYAHTHMKKKVVVLFPSPGAGHVFCMVELAKQIIRHNPNHISITIFNIPSYTSPTSLVDSSAAAGLDITFIDFPQINPCYSDDATEGIPRHIESYMPAIAEKINYLSSTATVSAIIVDIFCTAIIDVAKQQLSIPCYVFLPGSAWLLVLMLSLSTINEKYEGDLIDLKENIEIPGISKPFPPSELPPFFRRKADPALSWLPDRISELWKSDGFLVNTFEELGKKSLEAIMKGDCSPEKKTPPVYTVGPLLALDKILESTNHECLRWLDTQPDFSVVFLSFGTMGRGFDPEQIREIAYGLELSGHRFLWVVRIEEPGILTPEDQGLDRVLPPGFLEKTKDQGMIWQKWAPQVGILSHRAIGGFVSHCGWNSTLESLWFGVPLITWPLYADHRLTAFVFVNELGLSVGLRKEGLDDDALVLRGELSRAIKSLMEGDEGNSVRENTKRMKEASKRATAEGGHSYSSLRALVQQWSN